MLKTILPRRRFNLTDYPNMATTSKFLGAPIPIGYGDIHNIIPVCVDATAKKYKILDPAIGAISAIRTGATPPVTLVLNIDYTQDLPNAEFTLLDNYKLTAYQTYYFGISCDYPASDSNYLLLKRNTGTYADGDCYSIDGSNVWTSNSGTAILFTVWGKTTLTGAETAIINNSTPDATGGLGLNKIDGVNVRIGQKFVAPSDFYITKITVYITLYGTLTTKYIYAKLYTAYTPTEAQIYITSPACLITAAPTQLTPTWVWRNVAAAASCDIEGPQKTGATITNVADVLEDIVTNILLKSSSLLDATYLAALKAARTQALKIFLDRDIEFDAFLGKLEAGQLWKLIPLQDGTYAPIAYISGEPGGTSHFMDEDFISFKMTLDYSGVKQKIKVKYEEDPGAQEFQIAEATSAGTKFYYGNEEELEIETYLSSSANAVTMAGYYKSLLEVPLKKIIFEVHDWMLDKIPARDKVKITRVRAAYANAKLGGVLFRVISIVKHPGNGVCQVTAILDTQTYV